MDALSCALFPASCALCGSSLPQLSSAPICQPCWLEFPLQTGPVCLRCGDTLDAPALAGDSADDLRCRICRLAPPAFVRAVTFGLYQDRMRSAIHALKYDRLKPAASFLGRMLAEAIGQLAETSPAAMLVVPVPLHRSKHSERGFNQARALTEQALRCLRKTHPGWRLELAPGSLMRLRATESQAGLTVRKRRLNVRGAFTVSRPATVAGKHILLVDDIFTTGATVRSAAAALIGAGASSVRVATLARARLLHQRPHRAGQPQPVNSTEAMHPQAQIDSSHHEPSF